MEKKKMNKTALKYGSISIGLTAVVIALVIVFNLVIAELPAKWTKIDTSTNGLVSFTEETKQYLEGVNDKVEIFLIAQTGYEDQMICQLLDYYKSENSNLSVKYIDPVKNPTFVSEYTEDEIADNSIIVKSDKRSKVVDGSLFYIYETYDLIYGSGSMIQLTKTEWETYYVKNNIPEIFLQQNGMPLPVNEYFNGESLITSAIDYVITEKLPVLYSVTGHGETAIGAYYSMILDDLNVTVKEVNLVAGDKTAVPEDAQMLFINAPTKDIFEKEVDVLKSYVDKGGIIILTTDLKTFDAEKMPNLSKLTEYMGMKGNSQLVSENDKSYYIGDTYTIIPNMSANGYLGADASNGLTFVVLNSHGIEAVNGSSYTVSPVLTTTEHAQYDKAEAKGAINLAMQAVNGNGGAMYWFANAQMFGDLIYSYGYHNYYALARLVYENCAIKAPIEVALKSMTTGTVLTVTEADEVLWSAVYLVIIPVGTLIAGFAVWFKRRRR